MNDESYEIGTLIDDGGKIGIIYRELESGDLNTTFNSIKWRKNYEIYYLDGDITVMASATLSRLIKFGHIVLLDKDAYDLSIEDFKKR